MIRLDIQEYCGACCDFEPDIAKPVKNTFATALNEITVVQSDTIIRCKHAKRCECIKRYLKQQLMEETKNNEESN